MSKTIKLTNDTYIDSSAVMHNKKALNSILDGLISFKTITSLNLVAGSTYNLSLPTHTLVIEPLVKSNGSNTSGGQFIIPNNESHYITNNDYDTSQYKGIWIRCSGSGLISVSDYRHCGAPITGFRIWYLNI